jgi:hypothetical protein
MAPAPENGKRASGVAARAFADNVGMQRFVPSGWRSGGDSTVRARLRLASVSTQAPHGMAFVHPRNALRTIRIARRGRVAT